MTHGNTEDSRHCSEAEEKIRARLRSESHCPYCQTDTTESAYVHPEYRLRYCSHAHADEHVGVATWYTLHEDWACVADEYPSGPWRFDSIPPEVPAAQPCAAPSGMVDGADVVAPVFDAAARRAFPTHCASCAMRLNVTGERGSGDVSDAEFPYCRSCYRTGDAFAHVHADLLALLRSYGLRGTWWNTGGGCWILATVRADAPDTWAEQEDGTFAPFVCIAGAHHDGHTWHVESGEVSKGEDVGGMYFPDEDTWCGELGTDAPVFAGGSWHDLAAFCLRVLPASPDPVPAPAPYVVRVDGVDESRHEDIRFAFARLRELARTHDGAAHLAIDGDA